MTSWGRCTRGKKQAKHLLECFRLRMDESFWKSVMDCCLHLRLLAELLDVFWIVSVDIKI
jgi:hypothetical protein